MKQLYVAAMVITMCGLANADTLIVPDEYGTITDAVNAVQDGDTIMIRAGTYYEQILLNLPTGTGEPGQHENFNITIMGDPAGPRPVIDGQYQNTACLLKAGANNDISLASLHIEGLIFTRARSNSQPDPWNETVWTAAIHAKFVGHVSIDNCLITKCDSDYQHSNTSLLDVYGWSAQPDLYSCSITDVEVMGNISSNAVRLDWVQGGVDVHGITIKNNSSPDNYGERLGLKLTECSDAVISNSLISDNMMVESGSCYGTGIYSNKPFFLYNSIVCGNFRGGCNYQIQVFGSWVGSGNVISEDCADNGASLGACCLQSECVETDAYECGIAGGAFQGPLTTCDQVDCSNEGNLGACCVNGQCAPTNEYVCTTLGGEWAGEYTTCDDVTCTPPPAIAACCVSDNCLTTLESVCDLLGGIWQGDTSNCKSAACESWVGACCVAGACTQISLEDCANLGGTYFGDLTACEDIECPGTCLGDLNADGDVSVDDILILISGYGPCP